MSYDVEKVCIFFLSRLYFFYSRNGGLRPPMLALRVAQSWKQTNILILWRKDILCWKDILCRKDILWRKDILCRKDTFLRDTQTAYMLKKFLFIVLTSILIQMSLFFLPGRKDSIDVFAVQIWPKMKE